MGQNSYRDRGERGRRQNSQASVVERVAEQDTENSCSRGNIDKQQSDETREALPRRTLEQPQLVQTTSPHRLHLDEDEQMSAMTLAT